MLDARMRPLIDPPLDRLGRALAHRGVTADGVTLAGLALGLVSATAIALGHPLVGLALLALNRLADGLDGAVARFRGGTDLGGFLDIVSDFAFYGAIPLAFAIADPAANALPAAALIAAFYVNGAGFLAFAAIAARRGLETSVQGSKSFYYSAGLAEGTETIAFFVAFCLFPALFPAFAYIFAALCLVTTLGRVALAAQTFRR